MARYVYQCPVRWSDLDAFGHVNNARFLTLYEEARVSLMFNKARADGLTSFEEGVVISRHEVDYLRPVDYATVSSGAAELPRVRIELWVEDIRPSRFVIAYEMFDKDRVASRARSVCVPFDLAGGRPRRLSGPERDFLAPWLA
jgi:acyl-CoA thioester hydrolase